MAIPKRLEDYNYKDVLNYGSVINIRTRVCGALGAPIRRTVSDTMSKTLFVKGPGGKYELWSKSVTPYMVEPADCLTERQYQAVAFVGPARSGKSLVVDGMLAHSVTAEPLDLMIVEMTKDLARDYSKFKLAGIIANSPDIKRGFSPIARDDNVYDKFGRNAQIIKIAWPTPSQLSEKEFRWVAIKDRDRIADSIEGEGEIAGMALKRITTYLSAGVGYFESSPGRDLLNASWKPEHPHEGPPVTGIVSLYNSGDQRQFYWTCMGCGENMRVEPGPGMFPLDPIEQLVESIERMNITNYVEKTAIIPCKHCGFVHTEVMKQDLNEAGVWIPRFSNVNWATFWLGGAAAKYQEWRDMLRVYLQGVLHYSRTGSDDQIRRSIAQDFGGVHIPLHLKRARVTIEGIRERREEWNEYSVPPGVRFLIATVDVQQNRFPVQVTGYGANMEKWPIDFYNLRKSYREGAAEVQPASFIEDWEQQLTPLLNKSYPLDDGSGRRMQIAFVGCDSGGEDGVTDMAYKFYRLLRRRDSMSNTSLHKRFILVKGASTESAPRVRITYPDNRTNAQRKAQAMGDIPVLMLNTSIIKDALHGGIGRDVPGPGYIHVNKNLGDWWLKGFLKEQRDDKGRWPRKAKGNEPLDLMTYSDGIAIYMQVEKINWDNPPVWAANWDTNPLVFKPDVEIKPPTTSVRGTARRRRSRGAA